MSTLTPQTTLIPSRWQVFSAAPHRMMFFAGALQIILVMGLWFLELVGRAGWWPTLSLAVAPTWAHMFLMLYGVFPFFIFGFLITVYPRWMGTAPTSATAPAI